jgi:Fic family protein
MKNFGTLVKDARLMQKLKLVEVADMLQIDKALLSKIEKGDRYATRKQVNGFIRLYRFEERLAVTTWLSDKILYDLQDETFALDALLLAEDRVKYNVLSSVGFDSDKELEKLLNEADKLQKKWTKKKPLDKTQLHKMKEYFNLNYTYESNKIEGNTLTLKETFLVVNEGLTIGGKTMNEHLEAINHSDAIDFVAGLIQDKEILTERVLQEIHYLILKGIDKENAGKYRRVPVMISGSAFVPPQPYLITKMMEDVFIYYQKNKSKLHPIVLAADMHEKIVTVHPFIDGNGRTCRLIMNLILLANGFTVGVLKGDVKSRMKYYTALEEAQTKNDRSAFYKLVAQTCIDSLNEHIKMAG